MTFRGICTCLLSLVPTVILAQSPSRITEEVREILTYPFSDPSPVVTVSTKTSKIFPYTTFEGYSKEGKKQKWKVVKLENDYVEVYVLPEIGERCEGGTGTQRA